MNEKTMVENALNAQAALFASSNSPTKCMVRSFTPIVLINKICDDQRKMEGRQNRQMRKSHNRSK